MGSTVGGCAISTRIGEGYAGIVYAAQQVTMDRGVAVKILKPGLATDPVFSNEFFSRAKAAGQHHHANVVQIFDVGSDAGFSYIVYEQFPNGSLASLLMAQNQLPWASAFKIVKDVALALQYAKTSALVHGAICPENIFLTDAGQAKLGDLGVGGLRPASVPISASKSKYMAPEQCQGHLIDARTDIYALGILFYRMLAGAAPYEGSDAALIQQQHTAGALPDLNQTIPGLPANAKEVLAKMLAPNPDHRYISADALVSDLEALESGGGQAAPMGAPASAPGGARAPRPATGANRPVRAGRSGSASSRKRGKAKAKPKSSKEYMIMGGIVLGVAILVGIGLTVVADDPHADRRSGLNPNLSGGAQTLAKVDMLLTGGGSRNENYQKALHILDNESHRGNARVKKELAELHRTVKQCVQEIPLAKAAVKEYNAYVDFEKGAGNSARISRIDAFLSKYGGCKHASIKGYCSRMRRRKKQIERGEV
jgi:hypothetical protein